MKYYQTIENGNNIQRDCRNFKTKKEALEYFKRSKEPITLFLVSGKNLDDRSPNYLDDLCEKN